MLLLLRTSKTAKMELWKCGTFLTRVGRAGATLSAEIVYNCFGFFKMFFLNVAATGQTAAQV